MQFGYCGCCWWSRMWFQAFLSFTPHHGARARFCTQATHDTKSSSAPSHHTGAAAAALRLTYPHSCHRNIQVKDVFKEQILKSIFEWLLIAWMSLSVRWRRAESSYCSVPVPQQSIPGCSAAHGWRDTSGKDPGHCIWWCYFHWMWPVLCWARHRREWHLQTLLPVPASYRSTPLLQVALSHWLCTGIAIQLDIYKQWILKKSTHDSLKMAGFLQG